MKNIIYTTVLFW